MSDLSTFVHASHWGAYLVDVQHGRIRNVRPHPLDPEPSALLGNVAAAQHRSRIRRPMVRRGWLRDGPARAGTRGEDTFVPLPWDDVLERLAGEIRRVSRSHGNEAIFGGSYGWSSAGRFHHAQSQIHRFLSAAGGYVDKIGTYSHGAATAILPHVVGRKLEAHTGLVEWDEIAERCELLVAFGGVPAKNLAVNTGGITTRRSLSYLRKAHRRGMRAIVFSPIRDDYPVDQPAEWIPLRPGSDVAVMLALAYVLVTEGLHDEEFLHRYTVGHRRFLEYVLGRSDGLPKTPSWASELSEVPAAEIERVARLMASSRTVLNVSWSLQRTQFGEQPPWLGLVLCALLGNLGRPGEGFAHGLGSLEYVGRPPTGPLPTFPTLPNPLSGLSIPAARWSDMLLHPGTEYDFNGQHLRYPDVRLVYWAGGNPFHHHQDIARMRKAFQQPETVVVHECYWTATARHADIIIPATTTLERNDLGVGKADTHIIAMQQAIAPVGQARNDFDVFSDLADALGVGHTYHEGRDADTWIRQLYERWRSQMTDAGDDVDDFDEFWSRGWLKLPAPPSRDWPLREFLADPDVAPLGTPSGRIEVTSSAIESYRYADCPAHPSWLEPDEWLGNTERSSFPLHLIANNPASRLHSQIDAGATSQSTKIDGREPVRMNPVDAALRGIRPGDVVRVFNHRGSCLAGAVLTEAIRAGVVQLSTGARYSPADPSDAGSMCLAGNPNVLIADRGTSRLAQGCSGQHALVEVERHAGDAAPR